MADRDAQRPAFPDQRRAWRGQDDRIVGHRAGAILRGEIDRVVVIAPRAEVVNQWSDDFRRVTGRFMSKVTGRDGDIGALGTDVCATWSAVQGLQDALQAVCRARRVLVICDEHHHAAVEAAWGMAPTAHLPQPRFVLVLTGTPIRSDGAQSVWLAYDDMGAIDHPEAGTYTLTYGDAVDLGYCRPVTFHRHEGHFTVDLEGGEQVQVSGRQRAALSRELARVPGLQRALDFYRLACTPQYEKDGISPLATVSSQQCLSRARRSSPNCATACRRQVGWSSRHRSRWPSTWSRLIEQVEGEVRYWCTARCPTPRRGSAPSAIPTSAG